MSMQSATQTAVSIAPMLSVRRGIAAVEFYKAAFNAEEVFRIENESSVVSRLSIHGASDGSPVSTFDPDCPR